MNHQNPYITGNPVGDTKAFVGRGDILRDLLKVVESPDKNAIVLYGQRRIGKTSVLQRFEKTLREKGEYRIVNFDLMGKAKDPFGKVWAELEKRIRNQFNSTSPSSHGHSPSLDWLPTLLEDDKGPPLVLLLDEFDALEEWEKPEEKQAISELFLKLRKLLDQHKNFNCVFTIGRDIKHLSSRSFSHLDGIDKRKVSLLEEGQMVQLINLSRDALDWTPEAIKEVERLTNGQAYCVQLLCSEIWERFSAKEKRPTISLQQVTEIVPQLLAPTIFNEDIWDGLRAAGKVIASVLSEFDGGATREQLLKETQERGGIASVVQEDLEKVPDSLVQWDLIELTGDRYKFKVELIRLHIKKFKPFDEMLPELDRLTDTVADEFYQTAFKLVHQHREYNDAIPLLRKAIERNPRHIKANKLLARIFQDQGKLEDAYDILRNFSRFSPRPAKTPLINVLLALASHNERDQDKLNFYRKVLEHDPTHSEANKQQQVIQARIEAKRRLPLELAKKFVLAYQKRIAQVTVVIVGLGVSYFLPVGFPSALLFEIVERTNDSYRVESVPSSKSHSLVSLQITVIKPNVQSNVQPKEVTFKHEDYKPITLTPLANTENPIYQIDSTLLKLKGNTFQYPFFEKDKAMPLPFVFAFQFENDMTQKVDFTCGTNDPKMDCIVTSKGYASLLRGIPWWMVGTLLGIFLVILIETVYAIRDRERDDVL